LVYKLRGDVQTDYINLMNYLVYNETVNVENIEMRQSLERRKSNGSITKPSNITPTKSFLASLSDVNNSLRKKITNFTKIGESTLVGASSALKENQIATNPFVSLGEISLNKGSTQKFFPEEPVRTKYGRGFVINEFIENNTKFVKIKYKYGYGIVK